jgi:hypothetical protein
MGAAKAKYRLSNTIIKALKTLENSDEKKI